MSAQCSWMEFVFIVLQEETTRIAEKWTELLKTGSINAKIYAVDRGTIMFILSFGQDTTAVRTSLNFLDFCKLGLLTFEHPVLGYYIVQELPMSDNSMDIFLYIPMPTQLS